MARVVHAPYSPLSSDEISQQKSVPSSASGAPRTLQMYSSRAPGAAAYSSSVRALLHTAQRRSVLARGSTTAHERALRRRQRVRARAAHAPVSSHGPPASPGCSTSGASSGGASGASSAPPSRNTTADSKPASPTLQLQRTSMRSRSARARRKMCAVHRATLRVLACAAHRCTLAKNAKHTRIDARKRHTDTSNARAGCCGVPTVGARTKMICCGTDLHRVA